MSKPRVAWIMGSDSDLTRLEGGIELMRSELQIPCEVRVFSAHRTPHELSAYLDQAEANGIEVFITAAGWSAALPGVVAAHTVKPVIGIPIASSALNGQDAIHSMVMMPGGIPVATMSLDSAGAKNAALFAAAILARGDEGLTNTLKAYRAAMAEKVLAKDAAVRDRFGG
jgi:5-(carboxyamino)imidazole ribonucleotide mutase